jgi:hypothetical protein
VQAASTGRSKTSSCRSGGRWSRRHTAGQSVSRWPGITYALPARPGQPHHSAVITGMPAGIDALIELAGEKTPRRTGRLCENYGQDAVGRADAIPERRSRIPHRDDRRALEHRRGRRHPPRATARGRLAAVTPPTARAGDGSDVPARWQRRIGARPPGRVLARPTSSARRSLAPEWYRSAAGFTWGWKPGPRPRQRLPVSCPLGGSLLMSSSGVSDLVGLLARSP